MIPENYIFDALEAEREGVEHPIDFDVIWESLGYKRFQEAQRFMFSSVVEYLTQRGLCSSAPSSDKKRKHDKVFLSAKGLKFAQAKANTEKGAENLMYLLDIEERYLKSLERTLNLDIPESTQPPFPYTIEQLHVWSGYAHFWYTKQVLKEDYELGADYITIENKIYVSLDTAYIFLIVARPDMGTTIPEEIRRHLCPWDKFQKVVGKRKSKKNRRRSCSKYVSPGQTKLF